MKMNRILAFLLAVMLCFTAVACGSEEKTDDNSSTAGNSSEIKNDNTDSQQTNENSKGEESENDKTESSVSSNASNQNTSSGKDNGNKDNVSKNSLDFGGKTVTFIYEYQPSNEYGIDPSRDLELDRIKELNKKYNVKIVMKKGAANYNEAIVSSIAAGAPIGNVIRINGNKNYDFIKAGLCADLTAAMKSTGIDMKASHYNQRVNKYYNVNGKQYVASVIIPQEPDAYELWFYNKDVLAELGYKSDYIQGLYKKGNWTWAEATKLFAAATKKSANGTITRYALGDSMAYRLVTTLALSNNGKIGGVNSKGAPTVNLGSKNVRAAMQQVYEWGAVKKYIAPTQGDETYTKFKKGELFMCAAPAGQAKQFYNSGVNFGVIYAPKGPNGKKNIAPVNAGNAFMIPVTYQKDAAKYLMLLDELYAPYKDISREEILKNDAISYFSDVDSWNVYKESTLNESVRVNDDFTVYNLEWVKPEFGTVCLNLVKGTATPGVVVEKYNDQYQALLNDLFKGYSLTGIK